MVLKGLKMALKWQNLPPKKFRIVKTLALLRNDTLKRAPLYYTVSKCWSFEKRLPPWHLSGILKDQFAFHCRPPWILVHRDLHVKAEEVSLGDVRRHSGSRWWWYELSLWCQSSHFMAGRTRWPHLCLFWSHRTGWFILGGFLFSIIACIFYWIRAKK